MLTDWLKLESFFYDKKRCPKCGLNRTKKYGKRNGRQQYFCNGCKRRFQLKNWNNKRKERLWNSYAAGKQTQQQIADDLGKSRWWVNQELQALCSLRQGKNVYFVTDVGIIKMTTHGLVLVATFQGISIEKDIFRNSGANITIPSSAKISFLNPNYMEKGFLEENWIQIIDE